MIAKIFPLIARAALAAAVFFATTAAHAQVCEDEVLNENAPRYSFTVRKNGAIDLLWTVPAAGQPTRGYAVRWRNFLNLEWGNPAGENGEPIAATTLSYSITGLDNNAAGYIVQVGANFGDPDLNTRRIGWGGAPGWNNAPNANPPATPEFHRNDQQGDMVCTTTTPSITVGMPPAQYGTPPYTYVLEGLPGWASFDATTRTLSGTPTVSVNNPATVTHKVTDANGKAAEYTFTITVTEALQPPPQNDVAFDARRKILTTTLAEGSGGTAPLSYTLGGSTLPPGLTFNAERRELTGTPTRAGEWRINYTVHDAASPTPATARSEFYIRVSALQPGIPQNFQIFNNGYATLHMRMDEPADTGAADITHYRVRYSKGAGTSNWVTLPGESVAGVLATAASPGETTTYALTGLDHNAQYEVQAAAVNSHHTGDFTASQSGGTPVFPAAPGAVHAEAAHISIALLWAQPANANAVDITGYRYRWSLDSNDADFENADGAAGVAIPGGAGAFHHVITGLSNGTEYSVWVAAETTYGTGAWSAKSAETPLDVSSEPLSVAAAPGRDSVALSWDVPTRTGASAISGYRYRWTRDARAADWTTAASAGGLAGVEITGGANARSVTVSGGGLQTGARHWFQVAATNAEGTGLWSAPLAAIPGLRAPPPTNVQVVAGNAKLTLLWTPPADVITAHRYRWSNDDDASAWESAGGAGGVEIANSADISRATISGLSNDTEYEIAVAAVTAAGTGTWSATASGTPVSTAADDTFNLDVNQDGAISAADGILIARYLLGVDGASLLAGQATESATVTVDSVTAILDSGKTFHWLDVDATGGGATPDATDAILIARYLAGLRDAALRESFNGVDAAVVKEKIDAFPRP